MTGQERATRFEETAEQAALRVSVATMAKRYGWDYFRDCAVKHESTTQLWAEAGRAGFLGVAVPEQYGGGGGGIAELAVVCEELARSGCPLLMMVVSPAICGTVIARFGTPEQRERWLPGFADGSLTMAFGITEPDAGSNSHRLGTVARRDGDTWVLSGRKVFISGVDSADAVLIVGRIADPDPAGSGPTDPGQSGQSGPSRQSGQPDQQQRLRPALFVVPRDTPGFEFRRIDMEIVSPEGQFALFLDEVRVPADHLIGGDPVSGRRDAALPMLFAGLNPERIMVAAFSTGLARFALDRATRYVRDRAVWDVPIGSHQAIAHPLARSHAEVELARLMLQKAAALYDSGRDADAGEAANLAKYAAAEALAGAVDAAVQAHGGNGLATEYGVGALLGISRVARIAPVSREMLLNYLAQHSLGLPRSY